MLPIPVMIYGRLGSNSCIRVCATHTCDDVWQAGVKVLKQLADRVDEEEGVVITIQHPTVLSLVNL